MNTSSLLTRILTLFVAAGLAGPSASAATYTFIGTSAASGWGTATNFSPNGVPVNGDTIVFQGATGNLGVNGTTRTITNIDATGLTAAQTILGASGVGGSFLEITGTLSKGTAQVFNVRNASTSTLSVAINRIELSDGALNFGTSAATSIAAFSATSANVTGGSMFFFTNDGGTASIQSLNMDGGVVNLRNLTTGTTTLSVNSLSGTSATAQIRTANSASGDGARGILQINATGSSSFAGVLSNGISAPNARLELVKNGAGTQTLTGSNSYSGGSTLNAGTLLVNNSAGSGLGTGSVLVTGNTAVLGGNGGVILANNSNVTFQDGTLTVGNLSDATGSGVVDFAIGKSSGTSGLTLDSDVEVRLDIWSATSYERLVLGTLDTVNLANAVLYVDSSFTGWSNGQSFQLFDWGTAGLGGSVFTIDLSNLPTLTGGLSWDTSALYTTGVITVVVPEPSAGMLLGLGVGALTWRSRVRRRTAVE